MKQFRDIPIPDSNFFLFECNTTTGKKRLYTLSCTLEVYFVLKTCKKTQFIIHVKCASRNHVENYVEKNKVESKSKPSRKQATFFFLDLFYRYTSFFKINVFVFVILISLKLTISNY